jgi:hypothetical protein
MVEFIFQTIFLFVSIFIYLLNGNVVYSYIGEGYKATPLRCFAVGVGCWIAIALLGNIIFNLNISTCWWLYILISIISLFNLPKSELKQTTSLIFYYQAIVSIILLLPIFYFLSTDKFNLWQEYALYGKSFFDLVHYNSINSILLAQPLIYQLALLPVSFFTTVEQNIFACFNLTILAFVACEFVRNSGVKMHLNNVIFPLVATFALLLFNPFLKIETLLAADPFIFICAIGFAFAEYIYRPGHLPKTLAGLAPGLILMLLVLSSTQGFLLACSLFLILLLRYIIQFKFLTYKQLISLGFTITIPLFVASFWHFYLKQNGFDFLLFDINKLTSENIFLVYKALKVLAKEYLMEFMYIVIILLLAIASFRKSKTLEDLIIGRHLLKATFWITLFYVVFCLPLFFIQYQYIARASYALGFTSICLLQFILLMPIGRIITNLLNKMQIETPVFVKATIIATLFVMIVMNKNHFNIPQDRQIKNMEQIAIYLQKHKINNNIAIVDHKRIVDFYGYILNFNDIKAKTLAVEDLPLSLKQTHKQLNNSGIGYILLHAPNNIYIKSFEHNLDPSYSYLYKITEKSFILTQKFENKLFYNTIIK